MTSTELTGRAPTPPVFDVDMATRMGASLARRRPLPASYRPGALEAELTELSIVAQGRVALESQLTPAGPPRARVLDRGEWVAANVASVERLLGPALAKVQARRKLRPPQVLERIGHQSSAAQLASVLAWMSSRVLGQYDVLVGEEATVDEDVISYVGPNIVAIEQRYGFDPGQFRLWLALHETAHRAQFTGARWVRPYFLSLIEEVVGTVTADPATLVSALVRSLHQVSKGRNPMAEAGAVGLIASPTQLEALRRLSALMSVLEGHGEVVMDEAAKDLVPDARHFHEVLRARRAQPGAAARLVTSMLGIDAKLRQYEEGEAFVRSLREAGGPALVRTLFDDVDHLPTIDEVTDPEAWLRRMAPSTR